MSQTNGIVCLHVPRPIVSPLMATVVHRAFAPGVTVSFDGLTFSGVTTPGEKNTSGELLLVAIVEMAPGHTAAVQRYEDTVLGLLHRHGGSVERRMRTTDEAAEVHVIRFRSRAGYESFMVDQERLDYRDKLGDAAPRTRVLEVRDL